MNISFDSHILATSHKTGMEWYSNHLIRTLATKQESATYSLYYSSLRRTSLPFGLLIPTNNVITHFIRIPAKLSSLFSSRFLGRLWYDFCLPYHLRKHHCTVFHGTSYCTPASWNFKTVTTIHDLHVFVNPERETAKWRGWHRYWIDRSVRRADRIIVPSCYVRNCIERFFPEFVSKVRVTYLGVDHKEFYPIDDLDAINIFKQSHGLPDKYILYTGTVDNRKNPIALVRAYARLPINLRESIKLLIVGKIKDSGLALMDYISQLGLQNHVNVQGYVNQEDLRYFYNGATAFVFPSLHEGFGLPVLEAMACGVPVISSNLTSLPEVVGDAGILVDPNNVEELAQATQTVVTDDSLRRQMREKGIARARQFTWEKTAAETMAVYREAMGGTE